MLLYADAHKTLPGAVQYEYRDPATGEQKRSEHPHSWRVALLPYLDAEQIYKQYRFDEPWDSEANKKVMGMMTDVFHDPSDSSPRTNASYFVLDGSDAMFNGNKTLSLVGVRDGTSNTMMIAEARRDIPWTKPEDISYADEAIPQLGGNHPGIFLAAFADGSVRTIAENADAQLLRAYITPSGREVISPSGEVTLLDGPPPVKGELDIDGGYGDDGRIGR
jgi:hypothetical protein